MPAGNQSQGRRNEGQDRNSAAANRNNHATAESAGESVSERLDEASDRFREGYEAAREEMARHYRRAEGIVARHPGNSVLIGFGLGIGVGLALTALLSRDEESWADRYVPDSLRDLSGSIRRAHIPQHVRDAHVPESFRHLAEAIRDLPTSIAKAVGR